MTTKNIIEVLSKEAKHNKVANDVFHLWSTRRRARASVTIQALDAKMRAEGFLYGKDQYAYLLKILADCGLGKLQVDAKGRVKALKEIKATLQSIGKAGCQNEAIKPFKEKNRFSKLPVRTHMSVKEDRIVEKQKEPMIVTGLTVKIGKHNLDIPVPADVTSEELSTFINRVQSK